MAESLASGNSVNFQFDADDYISITGNAQVIASGPTASVNTTTTGTARFGPYAGGAAVRIIATGNLAYTLTQPTRVGQFLETGPNSASGGQSIASSTRQLLAMSDAKLRCVSNVTAGSLPGWRAMRDAGLGGVAAVLGNSITAGAGAGTGGTNNMVGAKARSMPTKLARSLTKLGVNARAGHFCSDQNARSAASITYDNTAGTSYDPNMAYTGTVAWSQTTLGGVMLRINLSGEKISYTPPQAFDSVEITYVRNAGLATVSVDVDGGAALTTINANGATGLMKVTVTGIADGVHTLNLTSTTAGQFYLRSLRFFSSTRPAIDIMSYGYWGGVVNDFNSTASAWSSGNAVAANIDAASLIAVKLTTNDLNGATSVSTYTTQMQILLGRIQAAGADILLLTDEPFVGANAISSKATTYIQALRDTLAVQYNCPFIDLFQFYGPAYNAAPGDYVDSLHPAETVAQSTADLLAAFLASV